MKKILLLCLCVILLTSCAPAKTTEKAEFSFEQMLNMNIGYVAFLNTWPICYNFNEYETMQFVDKKKIGALAIMECVDTTHYITYLVEDSSGVPVVGGHTINKCKITYVHKEYNGFDLGINDYVDIKQSYYIIPTDVNDMADMLVSFGASYEKNSNGEYISLEPVIGEYVLTKNNSVNEYSLNLCDQNTLPMAKGRSYTGILIKTDDGYKFAYLYPIDNAMQYNSFYMREEPTINIAKEVQGLILDK